MSRRLIVNADDFGLAPGVNRGILRAFRDGILTSTTLMANMPFFDDAVSLAESRPEVRVGVHLTLLWGRPVTPAEDVPSLVRAGGELPRSLITLARRYFARRLDLAEVRRELRSQIDRVRRAGIEPTHVDTHKHVHCLPGIMDAVVRVAAEAGVPAVRLPVERRLGPSGSAKGRAKRLLIGLLARNGRRAVERAGLSTPDRFVGIELQDRLDSRAILGILRALPEGVTELMCHPGIVDDDLGVYSASPPHRDVELTALCDPEVRKTATERGIELVHYGQI